MSAGVKSISNAAASVEQVAHLFTQEICATSERYPSREGAQLSTSTEPSLEHIPYMSKSIIPIAELAHVHDSNNTLDTAERRVYVVSLLKTKKQSTTRWFSMKQDDIVI